MQEKREPLNVRLKRLRMTLWFTWRYRSHDAVLEPYLAYLAQEGMSEPNISAVRNLLTAWKKGSQDRMAWYRTDRYVEAGMGAVDLVLIPVIIPMGVKDTPLFVATVALAISLVLVSSSLLVSFVKQDYGIKVYGRIHSTVNALSILSGAAALIATFWHDSPVVGGILLILGTVAFIVCALYAALARTFVVYFQLQSTMDQASQEPTDGRTEVGPHR